MAADNAAPFGLPKIESLLIVDDSPVQRQHAVTLCRELGIDLIYEAGNGHEALDLLAMLVLPPSLLIVDLEMPGMDGIELIQQLHQHHPDILLIVASSRERALIHSVEELAANLGLRVLAGLRKPLMPDTLGEALRRVDRVHAPVGAPLPRAPAPQAPLVPAALKDAIDAGRIRVHYQPKVDIRTGLVRGVEALARWHDPALGMIPPDRFIPVAEQEGLIHALTLSVMDQALAPAAAWNAHGLRLSVAVNLSPVMLDRADLVNEITALANRHAVAPSQVVLEVTETSLVAYLGTALGVLSRLRLRGFGLSIDDYGTGFSSMQQLARIPFTELKIDRSFVHGAHQRHNLRVILQSALDLARRLDLVTVAEGIETLEDWHLLQEFNCNIGQGFMIARPMPASEMPPWLRSHQRDLHRLRAPSAASPGAGT